MAEQHPTVPWHMKASDMTLRDYFAAAALANLEESHAWSTLAQRAYRIADAMMVQRMSPPSEPGGETRIEGVGPDRSAY